MRMKAMKLTQKNESLLLLRIVWLSAFVAILLLKYNATRPTQTQAVGVMFVVFFMVVNYLCGRFVIDRSRFPAQQRPDFVMRATAKFALVLGILGILLSDAEFARGVVHFFRESDFSEEIFGMGFVWNLLGFLFLWAGAYEIRVTSETIDYVSFIGGFRSLLSSEIDHARIRKGWSSLRDSFGPTIRMEIFPVQSCRLRPIVVNLQVFQKVELKRLFDWLGPKLRN